MSWKMMDPKYLVQNRNIQLILHKRNHWFFVQLLAGEPTIFQEKYWFLQRVPGLHEGWFSSTHGIWYRYILRTGIYFILGLLLYTYCPDRVHEKRLNFYDKTDTPHSNPYALRTAGKLFTIKPTFPTGTPMLWAQLTTSSHVSRGYFLCMLCALILAYRHIPSPWSQYSHQRSGRQKGKIKPMTRRERENRSTATKSNTHTYKNTTKIRCKPPLRRRTPTCTPRRHLTATYLWIRSERPPWQPYSDAHTLCKNVNNPTSKTAPGMIDIKNQRRLL